MRKTHDGGTEGTELIILLRVLSDSVVKNLVWR